MEIKIPLPQPSVIKTYQELKSYLKQFELAIHYAQKSVESAVQMGVQLTEDTYVMFEHPKMKDVKDKNGADINSGYYDEMSQIELVINLA
jgi:hypothetical protein